MKTIKLSKRDISNFLEETSICESLVSDDLYDLAKFITPIKYKKDEKIFWEGDTADSMYIIYSGCIKISKSLESGREIGLEILAEHTFFGEMGALFEQIRNAGASALTDSVLFRINSSELEELLFKYPRVMFNMLKGYADWLRNLNNKYKISQKNVNISVSRVLFTLGQLARLFGEVKHNQIHIKTSLSQKQMADFASVSSKTFSVEINKMITEGLIEKPDGRRSELLITDAKRFKELLVENKGE